MTKNIFFLLFMLLTLEASYADSNEYRRLSNSDIKRMVRDASEIDGAPGISEKELETKFGPSDSISHSSQWTNGKRHIYKLTHSREMIFDIVKGRVYFGVIEIQNDNNYLLYK